jgi:S1-C subfamily serine protease
MKQFLLGLGVSVLILFSALGGALADRVFVIKPLDFLVKRSGNQVATVTQEKQIVSEENMVTDVASKVSPSVVTVAAVREQRVPSSVFFDPYGSSQMMGNRSQTVQKDIGSGFVVDKGIIVTNKHVVSDLTLKYKVIDTDNNEYKVTNIYRDPVNDLAIIRIENGDNLTPITIGDSDNLKVGQSVVAIGTALGEFRHTVTTGVISGLGRGISAGDPLAGYVEKLENVIQTDAAINPGNSGGPLLNSSGKAIGVNVAVADGAQNVGFAIPINVVKDSLSNFNATGKFERAYLGVSYQMISKEVAILNELPQGAYVREVVPNSPAEEAGVKPGDIITSIDGQKLTDVAGGLASIINKHKIGDQVTLDIDRDNQKSTLKATLKAGD